MRLLAAVQAFVDVSVVFKFTTDASLKSKIFLPLCYELCKSASSTSPP